jgi:hypothetical protein
LDCCKLGQKSIIIFLEEVELVVIVLDLIYTTQIDVQLNISIFNFIEFGKNSQQPKMTACVKIVIELQVKHPLNRHNVLV